jgi:AbrB family looped-hinge helix DNA binding protein
MATQVVPSDVGADQVETQVQPVFRVQPEPLRAKVTIGDKGRIVIPAAIRDALGFEPGETIDLEVRDHELHISTRWNRMARAQERARKLIQPGRSIVDEFLAERRAEAQAEMDEWPQGAGK